MRKKLRSKIVRTLGIWNNLIDGDGSVSSYINLVEMNFKYFKYGYRKDPSKDKNKKNGALGAYLMEFSVILGDNSSTSGSGSSGVVDPSGTGETGGSGGAGGGGDIVIDQFDP